MSKVLMEDLLQREGPFHSLTKAFALNVSAVQQTFLNFSETCFLYKVYVELHS